MEAYTKEEPRNVLALHLVYRIIYRYSKPVFARYFKGRGKQFSVSLRPAWSIKQVQGSQGYIEKPCFGKPKLQTKKPLFFVLEEVAT